MSKRRQIVATTFSLLLILVYTFLVFPLNHLNNGSEFLVASYTIQSDSILESGHKMYGLIDLPYNENSTNVGGFPIAMALFTDGVIVDDVLSVETAFGRANPSAQLKKGDFITKLNEQKIFSSTDLDKIINSPLIQHSMNIEVLRSGETKQLQVKPALEEFSNKYRLGLVVRDYLLGVGMVSYINDDNGFGCLGHPISDSVAGRVPIQKGIAYECEQLGINKGEKGQAGELKIRIKDIKNPIGEIYKSTNSGLYGKFFDDFTEKISESNKKYSIAPRKLVKMGDAYIYSQLNGTSEFYKIEIIRAINQSEYSDKGLIVRVTDPKLLNLTGGIVQGMSGSPIIQNNRLIGAITHVFVNDPTKGYGIYMDFMHES